MSLLSIKSLVGRVEATIHQVVTLGTSSDTFHEDNYRVRLVNGFCAIVITMISFFAIVDAIRAAWLEVAINLATIALFHVPIFLNYTSKQYQARVMTTALGMLATLANIYVLGPRDLSIALFVISGCVACIVFPPREIRTTLVFMALTLVLAGTFMLVDLSSLIPSTHATLSPVSRGLNLLAVAFTLSGLFLNSSYETSRFLKQLKESVNAQQLTLHQSQANARLASVGELAAGLAHEINNPLAIIGGMAWRIKKRAENPTDPNSDYANSATKILTTVDRISQITKGMLAFARKNESDGTLAEMDALDAVRTTVNLFNELGKSQGVQALIDTELSMAVAKGNSGWIQQILLNLLSNAKYALMTAGCVNITALEIKLTEKNGALNIDVCDFGDGIPPEIEARLMEPFFTTKPVGAGTGLGLSISKGLAQSMGGDLTIVSRKNPTTFRLTLQLTASKQKSDVDEKAA